MSNAESQPIKMLRPDPEVAEPALTVLKELNSLTKASRKKPAVIELRDGETLGLTLSRKRIRARWVIRLDEKQTSCAACKQRAKDIYVSGKNPPQPDKLSEWLEKILQEHRTHLESQDEPPTVKHDESATSSIKVQMPVEKNPKRIKVLHPDSETSLVVAPQSPPQGARIKINDGGEGGVSRGTKLEIKNSEETKQRIHEPVSNPPRIVYGLSSSSIVDITFSALICKHLIQHCCLSLQHGREVGGVLYGFKNEVKVAGPDGASLYSVSVSDLIQFRAADSSGSRLHLNTDSWAHVSRLESEAGYEAQNKIRLGWYHTHPTQGIFFSRYDDDFHTVFSSPYQFAVVVDPRNMEAGLFYWDDYERRSLLRANNFMLSRSSEGGRETRSLVEASRDEELPAQPIRSELDLRRIFSFLLPAFALALIMVINKPAYALGPDQVCVLALIVVLGLSLWNSNWFHPKDPVEVKLITQLQQLIYDARSMADQIGVGRPHPASRRSWYKRLVVSFLLVLTIGALLKYTALQSWLWQRNIPAPLIHPVDPNISNNGAAPTPASIMIMIDISKGNTLTLKHGRNDNVVQVEYNRAQNNYWSVNQPFVEQQFFQQVFQWDLQTGQARPYIKTLQESLETSAGEQRAQFDGIWGLKTRQRFLEKAEKLALSGATFDMPVPDNKVARVGFAYASR